MQLKEIEALMREKPYLLNMGAGKLAKGFKVTQDVIKLAKSNVRFGAVKFDNNEKQKILVLDIETSPLRSYIWSLWNDYNSPEQLLSDFFIICWSAKWVGGDMHAMAVDPLDAKVEDDSKILQGLWTLLDQADIVVGHNSRKFDVKKINTRFILAGMKPPSPYRQVDTLEIAKQSFSFTSKKLDYLAKLFGIPMKHKTEFSLWTKCLDGDIAALNQMLEYNVHDVEITELVYLKLRPWMKSHPNMGVYNVDKPLSCSCCGSHELVAEKKRFYSNTGEFTVYRCKDCGAMSRSRTNNIAKEDRKLLLTSIPK